MDCNKEEAIRAKAIAEKKMEAKDFFGAKKVAQKAQQLYPDLENISQLIIVCDVHCSSQNTVYGNEKDWYAILNVEPTADDLSIKKQYRKLALLLHPDKNRFAGSDDAFKLIGEAQRVLLDREKRMLHDNKRKSTGRSAAPNWVPPRQPTRHPNSGQQAWTRPTYMPVNTQAPPQQSVTGLNEKRATFWTACPFCGVRYEFQREVINKLLNCVSCNKSFTGYETNAQRGAAPVPSWSLPRGPVNGGPHVTYLNPNSNTGFQGKTGGENSRKSFAKTQRHSEAGEGSKPKKGQPNEQKSHGKANGRRRKHVEESSESCGSTDSEEDDDDDTKEDPEHPTPDFQYYSEQPRRSSRSKRSVSYSEKNLNDDDDIDVKPSKKAKQEGEYPSQKEETSRDERELKQEEQEHSVDSQNGEKEAQKEDEKETLTETETEVEPEIYECPDPDFSDFDKDKKEEVFDVGQMWAVYDTQDAMPRFYARIRRVSPNFKLQITWLEPDPDDEDDMNWVNADLPVSCGKFKKGNHDKAEDHPMFSHLVSWEKGIKRDTFNVYPRKGQTWALYKNWDALRKWSYSNPDNESDERMKYEYEFAEILTDYDDSGGITVAYLEKVKGFACLFCRKAQQEGEGGVMVSLRTVPPKELYRFSHRVPSFQMTGEEREGVPKGSFELDPAALPPSLVV